MKYKRDYCFECESPIPERVANYSIDIFHLPLCKCCQEEFKNKTPKPTEEEVKLYVALKLNGVKAELGKKTKHITIDIAVTDAMVNIEVDGKQHNGAAQALADLKRTFYSFKQGYLTLRIPNSLVNKHLEETAEFIARFLSESKDQLSFD